MLERLWNGWRASYVQSLGSGEAAGPEPDGTSVFTGILESGLPDVETHIVHRGPTVFVILNRYPYAVGHVLVCPYRQVGELDELTTEEFDELWATSARAVAVIKSVYAPEGLNMGLNLGRPAGGSVSEHLHVHVVPRWTGDSNFMTATAETRTLPEALPVTAERLRDAW